MADNFTVTAIRGDLLERYFVLSEASLDAIQEVCFTCKGQGICVHLPYSETQGGYCLRLSSEETEQLLPRTNYYDLTAVLIDGNETTLIHNGTFKVLEKQNHLCGG